MYAQKYALPILMSNFCGEYWNTKAGGKSAFWNEKGALIISLNDEEEGLVIVERINGILKGSKKNYDNFRYDFII